MRLLENKLVRLSSSKVLSQLLPLVLAVWAFQTGHSDLITRLVVLIPIYAFLVRLGVDDFIIIQKQRDTLSRVPLEADYKEALKYGAATLPVAVCLIFLTFSADERDIALTCLIMQLASMEISARFYLEDRLCASIVVRPLGIALGSAYWLADIPVIPFELMLAFISSVWVMKLVKLGSGFFARDEKGYDWIFFIYIGLESLVWNLLPLQDIVNAQNGFDSFILQRVVGFASTLLVIIFYGYLSSVSSVFEEYKNSTAVILSFAYLYFLDFEQLDFNPILPLMLVFVTLYKYKYMHQNFISRLIVLDCMILLIFSSSLLNLAPLESFLLANFIAFVIIDFFLGVRKRI